MCVCVCMCVGAGVVYDANKLDMHGHDMFTDALNW